MLLPVMDVTDSEIPALDLRGKRRAGSVPAIAPNRHAHVLDSPTMKSVVTLPATVLIAIAMHIAILLYVPLFTLVLFGPPFLVAMACTSAGLTLGFTGNGIALVVGGAAWLWMEWVLFIEPGRLTKWATSKFN